MSRYRVRHDNFTLEVSRHALDRLWERTPLSWRERKQAFEAVIEECKSRALKPNDVLKFESSGIWWTIAIRSPDGIRSL